MNLKYNLFNRSKTSAISAMLCACLAVPLLGGCFFGAVAAITTGSLAAADRRTAGTQVEDNSIELKAGSAIRQTIGESVHVSVTSYNRQVLLSGEAPDEDTRKRVESAVAKVANVKTLVNDIQIAPISTISTRSNDAFITGKVKASLLDAQDLFANAVKVVTESGVVYLMGLLTDREADRAAQIAAGVSGVVKVVKVTERITESELSSMTKMPNNGTTQPAGPR